VTLAVLALPLVARAEPSAADRALATELFKQGRELIAAGQTAEACAKFAESQRLDPGGGTLLNLGLCYEKNGQLASAWTTLNEALGIARRDGSDDRIELATKHIAALEPRLSRLTVAVPADADVPGLVVLRDGSPVGRVAWGTAMPIDPGSHRIEASAEGYETWSTTVEVVEDASSLSVDVPALVKKPVAVPDVPPPRVPPTLAPIEPARERPPDSSATQRVLGWIGVGVGTAAVAAGTYFGLRALSKQSQSEDECRTVCSPQGADLSRDAGRFADYATVSFAVGIVGIGAGGYLLLTLPRDEKRARATSVAWVGRF
jgi:hypothetical protein